MFLKIRTMISRIPLYAWFVVYIQLLMLECVFLDIAGYNVTIFRQLVGFIYLTFIPGYLILLCLKLTNLEKIDQLLYSVGLSISCIMFVGFMMNYFYPLIGIKNPISIYYLLLTLNILVTALLVSSILLHRKKHSSMHFSKYITNYNRFLFSPHNLFLILLPILSIFGAFNMYFNNNNLFSLILIVIIIITVYLVAFANKMHISSYYLAVFIISLSLLWNITLISYELIGPDVFWEFVAQETVIINSAWDSQIHLNTNGMLSTVMLTPTYSIILNLNSTWVFKVIYPFLFSFLPLTLFQIYKKQTNASFALLSTFFFMSFPVFFSEMIQLPRQQIAELFISLSLLLMIDKNMERFKKSILLIIFLCSIIVSHYGTSYIYLFFIVAVLSLQYVFKIPLIKNLHYNFILKARLFDNSQKNLWHTRLNNLGNAFEENSSISMNYVLIFLAFCITWYMHMSSGSMFESAVHIIDHVFSSLDNEFFSLDSRDQQAIQALGLSSMRSNDVYWFTARIFQYITQLFILIGIFRLFVTLKKTPFKLEFILFVFVGLFFIFLSIILPYFATALNMSRIYHITLLFLSPFFILGGITFFEYFAIKLLNLRDNNLSYSTLMKLTVLVVLIPYFLFTTGFIFEITDSEKTSTALSLYDIDSRFFTLPEIEATNWLNQYGLKEYPVYTDGCINSLLYKYTHIYYRFSLVNSKDLDSSSYLFLRRWNIVTDTALGYAKQGLAFKYFRLDEIDLLKSYKWNSIYSNGESKIMSFNF